MRPTNILILAGLLGCGGGTTTPQCDDCGAPSECAEPFCGADGSCDPGYLTQSLDDDTAGDCLAPTCDGTGAEAVYVDDPADLPLTEPEAVCTVAACTESGPELLPAELGTACGESFCDGEALGDDACRMRCADTEPDPLATDAGCTRERPYCVVGIEGFTNAGCIAPTVWDEEWGTATIGIDGVAVANLGSDTNVRTVQRFSTGTYYWEIEVLLGDPEINDGGVGILNSEMPEDDAYIGATSTGLSFGYPPYTQYWTGWRNVVSASPTVAMNRAGPRSSKWASTNRRVAAEKSGATAPRPTDPVEKSATSGSLVRDGYACRPPRSRRVVRYEPSSSPVRYLIAW